MIGCDDLDASVEQTLPQLLVVFLQLDRRVHLDARAEPGIIVDVEKQMMWADFGGDQVPMVVEQFQFRAGRDVQHMEAVPVSPG